MGEMTRALLIAEFLFLFVALPLGYRFSPVRIPALPLLWIVAGYAYWQLLRTPGFNTHFLWNAAPLPSHLKWILLTFAIIATLIWAGVHWIAPQLEWNFVRANPVFWAIVMVAYPVLSVYPQGLLYRAFFFSRYADFFPSKWMMILASAAAFAFLHIIFRNWLAVGMTFFGGILFASLYAETDSLATSGLLHALFGCWIFTVGLGQYFYHGTIRTFESVMHK
jgi:membrane protease YdiL (CAAX protease family)